MQFEYLDEIKSNFYKNEINRILKKPNASDKERYFLTSFLKDQIKLNKKQICDIIANHNCWSDYNPSRTFYLVSRIFEKKIEKKQNIQTHLKPNEKIIFFATKNDYEDYLATQLENCLNRMENFRLNFRKKLASSYWETTPCGAGLCGFNQKEHKKKGGEKNW